jgi:predicted kinase
MQKIEVLVGIPGSGKSTYCKNLMQKEPGQWKRLNNDMLREAIDFGVYSQENEKIITDLRNNMLREFLKKGYNILIDNLNLSSRHWKTICQIAQSVGRDIKIYEKHFYVDLNEAIARDAKREGKSQVGEAVIKKWWKESGKEQFKFYKPKTEIFLRQNTPTRDKVWQPMVQDENLQRAVVFDNDGTIALIGNRSPYDASKCDEVDLPHPHVIEVARLYYQAGYKILFVSGREEKDRGPTERFYQNHLPDIKEYELFMRPTGDKRKDVIIKEEIFENHIKDKYYVAGWYDDRLQVSKWVFENGLPLFRVNDPEATF